MRRAVRRLVWLTVLLGAAAMTARWWASRSTPQPSANPQWPPFEPPVPTARPVVSSVVTDAGDESSSENSTAVTETPASIAASHEAAPTESASDASGSLTTATGAPTWVLPVDGECPDGYPIKANDNSRIYHVPGGRSYARTKAERCYVDAESAAADGYRAAKA